LGLDNYVNVNNTVQDGVASSFCL